MVADGCHAHRVGVSQAHRRDRHQSGRDHDQHPRHGGLYRAGGIGRPDPPADPEVPGADEIVFATHCHNDLGMATANALAAVEGGARQIECTINGLGERAGNTALEEVVMAMRVRGDILPFDTRIDTRKIMNISRRVARSRGFRCSPTRRSSARTPSPTRAASIRTACSRTPRPSRSCAPRMSALPPPIS